MKSTSHGISICAHQVGEEEDGALEHADQEQVAPGVVARDLRAELAHAVLQVVGLDEDLADARVAQHRPASYGARAGRGAAPPARARPEAQRAAADLGPQAAADVERAALGAGRAPRPCGDPTAGRRRRRRGRRAAAARAGGAPAAARAAPRAAGGRPAAASAASTTASSTAASSRSSSSVRSTFASAAGCSARSAGSSSWRRRLRANAGASLLGVLAPGEPARAAVRRGLLARDAQQRAHEPPSRAAMPSSARRPGEAASR